MNQESLYQILQNLSETSQHLAETAKVLAENAVKVGVPVKMPKGTDNPVGLPDILAGIAAGATVSAPPTGLPFAERLSRSAAQVALSASIAAMAVPVFAPIARFE